MCKFGFYMLDHLCFPTHIFPCQEFLIRTSRHGSKVDQKQLASKDALPKGDNTLEFCFFTKRSKVKMSPLASEERQN